MSTKHIEALKLALEGAANYIDALGGDSRKYRQALAEQPAQQETGRNHWEDGDVFERIAAMKKQPAQQEPVAWRVKVETKLRDGSVDFGYQLRNERLSKYDEPLYTSPPAQRKPWVGLTDEEIEDIWNSYCDEMGEASINDAPDIARAIESALRSKNT